MSNATAINRHFVEDVVLRLIEKKAKLERPSALPIKERLFIGMPGAVEGTLRRLGSA